MHEVGDAGEGDEVILDVLAGGEVAASAAEFVGDTRKLTHLLRSEQTARDFTTYHLDTGLTLAVDSVLQAEWAELGVCNLPCEDGHCLGPEGLDLLSDGCSVLILKLFALK
jgi:hypothetical protein